MFLNDYLPYEALFTNPLTQACCDEQCLHFLFATDCLQPFATVIANTLDVDHILLQMVQKGLLTLDQQQDLSNPLHTPINKRQKLCSIILSLDNSCVEDFLQCLSETSDYAPHKELLQNIRTEVSKCTQLQ